MSNIILAEGVKSTWISGKIVSNCFWCGKRVSHSKRSVTKGEA